ncbi:hypothetical protein D9615_010704 [Tricholomella constricta]|uniref:Uncharacterized protein n=1 Tax=Tricholomella constricta TaxID=117010 RepID=A0A8H5LQD0_9AGAR|nr:hypothetical protein D9615_010704 [Tricholomella constricta]
MCTQNFAGASVSNGADKDRWMDMIGIETLGLGVAVVGWTDEVKAWARIWGAGGGRVDGSRGGSDWIFEGKGREENARRVGRSEAAGSKMEDANLYTVGARAQSGRRF